MVRIAPSRFVSITQRVDKDKSGAISSDELQQALSNGWLCKSPRPATGRSEGNVIGVFFATLACRKLDTV